MKNALRMIALPALSAVLLATTYSTSEARIRCNGAYQIINGSPHATPYCGDEYLARVARTYGIRVSGRRIRKDYSKKSEICQLIGHDNRVSDICTGFRIEEDGDDDTDRS